MNSETLSIHPWLRTLVPAAALAVFLGQACSDGSEPAPSATPPPGSYGAQCDFETGCNAPWECVRTAPDAAESDERRCLCGPSAGCSDDADCTMAGEVCNIDTCECGPPAGDVVSSGAGEVYGECGDPCSDVSECSTPSEMACSNGTCVDDCTVMGCSFSDYVCTILGNRATCRQGCMSDDDCFAPATCSGEDDQGTTYCVDPTYNPPCTSDADCVGDGMVDNPGVRCDVATGLCSCVSDADCSANPYATQCGKRG